MRVRRWWVALLAAGLAAGCQQMGAPARVEAPADSAAGETAFDLAGPGGAALVVPVWLNGEGPFDFVLDTGATLTCVDHAVAERLRLPRDRRVVGVGAGIGEAGPMRLVRLDSLRVGRARGEDLTVCALDLAQIRKLGLEADGLLGLNFLRSFRVTVDFEREVLLLQDPD